MTRARAGLTLDCLLGDHIPTSKAGRRCKRCKAILSMYNHSNYCYVCQSKLLMEDKIKVDKANNNKAGK